MPNPATPGIDFAGRIVTPASGSNLVAGQLVFGMAGSSPFNAAALAEYAASPVGGVVAVPEGVEAIDAATVGVAGLTAYQSILPYVKRDDKVFINGGSGGTGVFGIQIAKAAGCHVTATCSSVNVELCKSLGADEVIDYRTVDVMAALKKGGPFDHVVDNVGADTSLYWRCHEYTRPGATFMMVAGSPSLRHISNTLKIRLWPGFLGGGKRKYASMFAEARASELEKIGEWMKDGAVKAVIDSKFAFDKAPDSFTRLKTGRSKGKVVIEVAADTDNRMPS